MSMASATAPAPGDAVLSARNVTKTYGNTHALKGVNFDIHRGKVTTLFGENGAGKSTLMKILSGVVTPTSGEINLDGRRVSFTSTVEARDNGISIIHQELSLAPNLSVRDNIRLGAFLKPEGIDARLEEMLQRFPRLRERLHQPAGLLSGGEQQMLALARGLMSQPVLLLLDEPSLGLAPKVIEELFAALAQLRSEGLTVLLVDQMAALALSLADRAYVLESGRVVAEGTAQSLLADGSLMRAYLGEGAA